MTFIKKQIVKLPSVYLFFLIASSCMHLYFVISGAYFSEVCCDSLEQIAHFYPFLNEQFKGGNFFWSWEYGMGGDVFGSFLYYYSASPFFWLTMLFDISSIADIFELRLWISIGKLFLAMVFMYHLMLYNQRTNLSSIISSLVYGGSLYYTFYSLRYDFMVDGMVWLPLVILSYERMVDKQKPGLFVFSIFLIVCSNFYLAFITTIYLFLYAGLKYFLKNSAYTFKGFIRHYVRLSLYYIAGLAMAAFSFAPVVYTYLHVDRFYYDLQIPLFFTVNFYKQLPYTLFFFAKDTMFSIVLPVIVVLVLLYGFFVRDKQMKARMVFGTFIFILALIPYSYSLFNGFSSIQYRWIYLFLFTTSYIFPFVLDYILSQKDKGFIVYSSIVMFVLLIAGLFKEKVIGIEITMVDRVILTVALLIYLLLLFSHRIGKAIFYFSLVSLVLFNTSFVNYLLFTGYFGDAASLKEKQHQLLSSAYDSLDKREVIQTFQRNDSAFYRVIWNEGGKLNAPLIDHYRSFSAYNSLLSGDVHQFVKKHYNTLQTNAPSMFKNLDQRLYIETVLGNKYYITPKSNGFKPYGYSLLKEVGDYRLYQNDFDLPIGFMYDSIVPEKTFHSLNFGERDQLLLEAAVIENEENLNLPSFDFEDLDVKTTKLDKTKILLQEASLNGDLLVVNENENAQLTIPYSFPKEPGETLVEIKMKKLDGTSYTIQVNGKTFTYFGDKDIYNYPKEEIVFNTGYEHKDNKLTITLTPGTYRLEEITAAFNPYNRYETLIKEKREQSLKNVHFTDQSVSGNINASKDGILFMSIPYSKGWHVKVDGAPSKTVKVNSAFIGIPISKGEHKVEMYYVTPYFLPGLFLSLVTIGLFISSNVIKRNRYVRKESKENVARISSIND